MKTEISENDFIDRELANIPKENFLILEDEIIRKNLSVIYQENKKRTEDIEFAKDFQKHCPTEKGNPEDYLYKIVKINEVVYWLSLRFWNRNIDYPFVDIIHFDNDIGQVTKNVKNLYQKILSIYSNIDVKNVRLSLYERDFKLLKTIDFEEDNLMLGKLISTNQGLLNTSIKIELVSDLTEEDYSIYFNEYNKFNTDQPSLNFIKAVPYEELKKSTKDGYVFKIYSNKNYCGLFSIVEDFYETYYGYCVFEKMIFKEYRGNNYSLEAQNLIEIELSKKLNSKANFLLGTISPKNKSSLKSALKSGRKVLMKQVMIKPKGYD